MIVKLARAQFGDTLCGPRAPDGLLFPSPPPGSLAGGWWSADWKLSALGSSVNPHPEERRAQELSSPLPCQESSSPGPPLSVRPHPSSPRRSQPTRCHLRTPRDSRNGLNSVGRSPGIRHEVTSRPLSGLSALPSAGLLSACQTGSGVGHRSLQQAGDIPGHSLPCPFCHYKSPMYRCSLPPAPQELPKKAC